MNTPTLGAVDAGRRRRLAVPMLRHQHRTRPARQIGGPASAAYARSRGPHPLRKRSSASPGCRRDTATSTPPGWNSPSQPSICSPGRKPSSCTATWPSRNPRSCALPAVPRRGPHHRGQRRLAPAATDQLAPRRELAAAFIIPRRTHPTPPCASCERHSPPDHPLPGARDNPSPTTPAPTHVQALADPIRRKSPQTTRAPALQGSDRG